MAYISIGTIWMDRTFLLLSILNAFILLLILSYQLRKENKKSSSKTHLNQNRIRLLNIFSVGTLIFTMIYGIQRSISGQGIGNCTLHVFFGAMFWLSSKLMMYLFFVSRLDVAFRSSSYRFSNNFFIFLYIIIIIAYVTCVLQYAIWGEGILVESEEFGTFCGNLSPLFTFIYLACWDFVISSTLTILFVKRLFDAFYFNHSNKNEINKKSLAKAITEIARYVTLTIIGVCTTVLALITFGTTSWFSAIAIDLIINNQCIFLMYKANKKYFSCLCGPFHKLIGKCFVCCLSRNNEEFGNEVIKAYDVTHFRSDYTKSNLSLQTMSQETDPETKTSKSTDHTEESNKFVE